MRHIIKPLLRHRMMPMLVVLQVALASAIACNALFLLQQKLAPILASDGVGQPDRLLVVTPLVARGKPWPRSRLQTLGASLRALPGVASVSIAGSLPMVSNIRMSTGTESVDGGPSAKAAFYVGDDLIKTLGLKLVAGRDFNAAEQATENAKLGMNADGVVIITRALAERLFPAGKAVGKSILTGDYDDGDGGRRTVVGVIAHLMRNDFDRAGSRDIDSTMLLPGIPGQWPIPTVGVRMAAGASSAEVIDAVRRVIKQQLGPSMVAGIDVHYDMYSQLRDRALAKSRAAVWLLAGVSLIVLLVTLAGIMGLTSYWVGQRTRQIGIRRALGARRADVRHEVQWENLVVVGAGVVLGLFAAYAINIWLMRHFELARLPWVYLPLGAGLLLLLGQLAALVPARRAAAVAPVTATRAN